ncbi:putative aromatic peroxygenase [Mollisia scopiformis]|uniref:Putative aromatic peroxygenase n=1 Tax=Mollisia scopiformis TaxID=149040 RepID=A0A194XVM5_MOLSC|nr:putative aromatic peroxygenase [Mollisia scopiformis]KUJ24283.1 putative aromatic peroxygenase [Mollisia scopiformis]
MKTSLVSLAVLAIAVSEVAAFPALAAEHAERLANSQRGKRSTLARSIHKKRVTFDPASQYTSTTGAHAFVPPNFAAGDVRGPCPGLNAAANHGYIPHNGVGTMGDFVNGTNEAYGMALDLGGFLAVYGSVFDGNLLGYSIGGPTSLNQLPLNNLLGLTGAPQGLSGSHNKYEADTSPTRGDLYLYGNDYEVQVPQFQQYYDALIEGVDADTQYANLIDFRIARFNDSITRNSHFFYSPFAGVLVSPAGFSFPVRMMANHSAEFPEGSLSKAQLMSFFSITGKSGKFVYTVGHERIPDNWYKRAIGDEYTIPGFLADVLDFGEKYPPLLDVGGNTGKTDSFTPVDIGSLTKGVFSAADLLEGNNLECYALQISQAALPDILGGAETNIGDLTQILKPLSDNIAENLLGLGCPTLNGIDDSQYDVYPGYNNCPNGCSGYSS